MKKIALFAAAAMVLLASCAKEELPSASADTQQIVRKTLEVGLDNSLTKTSLGTELAGKFPVVWTEGDEIAVIENLGTDTQNFSTYRLKSGAGTAQGIFEYVNGDAFPAVIKDVIYPASAMKPQDTFVDHVPVKEINNLIPVQQTYTKDSFDPKAAVMHFHSDVEAPIVLKPAASIVCIPLKGKPGDIVTSIRWQHFDGHTRTYDLTCPERGIELSDQVTNFYIALRPFFYDQSGKETAKANGIAFINLKNGSVQVKTPVSKRFDAGKCYRFPEWTLGVKSQWTIMYCSSESSAKTSAGVPYGPAKYMIDGNDGSWWNHLNTAGKPFTVVIDLGTKTAISKVAFHARKAPKTRPVKKVTLSFCNTRPDETGNSSWGTTQTIENVNAEDYWETTLKTSSNARYVRIVVNENWNDAKTAAWTGGLAIGEFSIL